MKGLKDYNDIIGRIKELFPGIGRYKDAEVTVGVLRTLVKRLEILLPKLWLKVKERKRDFKGGVTCFTLMKLLERHCLNRYTE